MQDKTVIQTCEQEPTAPHNDIEVHIHARTIIAVAATCAIIFAQLMALVGSALLAQSTAALLGRPDQYVWFASVITIITLATILPCSQAADYWGRKIVVQSTTVGGVVGAIVVSRSQDIATAITGFCFIGTAFGCQSLCYAIPSEVLHRKHRAYGQAVANIVSGMGAVTGVLVGGALTRNDDGKGFRIFWYINCASFVLGFIGIQFGYNPPLRELQVSLTTAQKVRAMDWIGNCMIALGLMLFCIGLQWSGNPYGWEDGHVLGPFIAGVCLLAAFLLYEWRAITDGILHHGLFGDRNFPLAILMIFVEGTAFITATAFFVFELVIIQHLDAFDGGLRFAVLFLLSMVSAFLVAIYTTTTRRIREPLALGFSLLIVFNILMVYFKETLPLANAYGYACIGGAGIGCILTNAMVAAQMSTPKEMISVTSGLITALRSLGGAVGLAISNAVFNNKLKVELPKRVAAAAVSQGLPPQELGRFVGAFTTRDQRALREIPGASTQVLAASGKALTEAFRLSFRNTWIAAAAFSAVGLVAALFLWNPKAQFTNYIDAPAEKGVLEAQERKRKLRIEESKPNTQRLEVTE
ncbi:PEP5 [Stagonosporopsis vannaccii]|nr:PEP5 [Stagonosporopsis vannaccii]